MHSPLRMARKKRDLKIKQVAAATGVDSGNLSRIERGDSASKETAEKLAAFFAGEITEIHILYPERFYQPQTKQKKQKRGESP